MPLSHFLNPCWFIANQTLGNNFQWNSSSDKTIFLQENAFENIVCQMAAILCPALMCSTHLGLVMPYGDQELGQH